MIDAYGDIIHLVERLHRHFLDVLRTELRRIGVEDINAVQALLLSNIDDEDLVIRDLKDRGYYQGSNVSYNIKKLTEQGYLAQERSEHDRRAVRVTLTKQGQDMRAQVRELQTYLASRLNDAGTSPDTMRDAIGTLHEVERTWTDFIRSGRR